MFSGEGEVVPFKEVLYPRGNVEDWLLRVEEVMKESLRVIFGEAYQQYSEVRGTLSISCISSRSNSKVKNIRFPAWLC